MKIKKSLLFLIFILVISILSGCSSSSSTKSAMQVVDANVNGYGDAISLSESTDTYSKNIDSKNTDSNSINNETNTQEKAKNNKIIYNGSLSISTSNIIETEKIVLEKIKTYDGYISNYNKNDNSYISIQARIPAKNFQKMLDDEDIAKNNTVDKSMSAEDVTLQYSDTEAELESLKIQEERLLEYLKSANNVSDMMSIENSLQNVRQKIETVVKRLKYLDSYIEYSELNISINTRYDEIKKDASFSERVQYAIRDSWHNFILFLQGLIIAIIFAFPGLIFIAILILIIIKIQRKRRKKYEKILKDNSEKEK